MIIALMLVLFGILAIALLFAAVRGQASEVADLEELPGRTQPVDLEAFRNLVDPQEEAFLKQRLPAREFRKVQRQRTRAALEYIRRASRNAAILIRAGEAARRSSDAELAGAAQRLVESALRLRISALLTEIKLYGTLLLPGSSLSLAPLLERYAGLTEVAGRLSRLRNPGTAGRITAAL